MSPGWMGTGKMYADRGVPLPGHFSCRDEVDAIVVTLRSVLSVVEKRSLR